MGDDGRKLVTILFLYVCSDKSLAGPDHTKEGLNVWKKCGVGVGKAKSEALPRTCVH